MKKGLTTPFFRNAPANVSILFIFKYLQDRVNVQPMEDDFFHLNDSFFTAGHHEIAEVPLPKAHQQRHQQGGQVVSLFLRRRVAFFYESFD